MDSSVSYDEREAEGARPDLAHPDQGGARRGAEKPDWIRVKAATPNSRFYEVKQILREHKLHSGARSLCPNIGECFRQGARRHS